MISNLKFLLSSALILKCVVGAAVDSFLIPRGEQRYVEVEIQGKGAYVPYIEIEVGTPKQTFEVTLDTGSGIFWVTADAGPGTYQLNDSTSAAVFSHNFSIAYLAGESAQGDFINDTVSVGGASGVHLLFGASKGTHGTGILGISPLLDDPYLDPYKSFPESLKQNGIIDKMAYSFYGQSGTHNYTLIFGGIDHEKYEGELKPLPWSKNRTFALDLTKAEINGHAVEGSFPMVFDTGSTVFYFEEKLANGLIEGLNGTRYDPGTVTFGNGNTCADLNLQPIKLTFADQVTVEIKPESIYLWDEGLKSCTLLMHTSDANLIGSRLMQDLYIAWDNDDRTIAIANSKKSSSKNIQPIT